MKKKLATWSLFIISIIPVFIRITCYAINKLYIALLVQYLFINRPTWLNKNFSKSFYKKIAALAFLQETHSSKLSMLKKWLEKGGIPRRSRIELGIYCWEKLPSYKRDELAVLLFSLCVLEAEEDLEYILKIYDQLELTRSRHCYIFNEYREDPEEFIKFARLAQNLRPNFLIEGLLRFINVGRNCYGDYSHKEENIRSACNELFEIVVNSEFISTLNEERIYRELILYSYPDEPWYYSLHSKLWEIESNKKEFDISSPTNHFLVAINFPENKKFINNVSNSYNSWLNCYKNFNVANTRSFVSHAKDILSLINGALNYEYPKTRNRSFDPPIESEIINESIEAYWEMISWLHEVDIKLQLYALETALEKPTFTVEVTKHIGDKSRDLFLEEFEPFAKQNIGDCASLLSYMISRSGSTEIKIYIREVLDIVYPSFEFIDRVAAQQSLKDGLKAEHGHTSLWKPRDYYSDASCSRQA